MTVWIDLTTSLDSPGVTGTVRSELEIARALLTVVPAARFYREQNGGFRALSPADIPWFFASEDVVPGFVASRAPRTEKSAARVETERLIAYAGGISAHAIQRAHAAALLATSLLPERVAGFAQRIARPLAVGVAEALTTPDIVNVPPKPEPDWLSEPEPPRAEAAVAPVSHPFAAGDTVFTAGIDWGLGHFARLKHLQKTLPLDVVQLIHDVTPIVVPHFHIPENQALYGRFFRLVSETCSHVLYSSKSTETDALAVQKRYGWPTPKSTVVRLGNRSVNEARQSAAEQGRFLASLGVNRDFVIYVSTIEARKNHETLHKAYRRLLAKHGDRLPQLVFVGQPGWKTGDLRAVLERDDFVKGHLLTVAPDEAGLDTLYRRCLFTLYPSLYEGWGLPVVESLSYGKPVLAAKNSSITEAGGALADYVDDAWDVSAWCAGIERWAFDRAALAKKTATVTRDFTETTWQQCAAQIAREIGARPSASEPRRRGAHARHG